MSYTTHATTTGISLEALVERLQGHPDVEGLVLIGSGQTEHFEAASDYDLLIVVAELPLPLRVGLTYIDHRLSDLLFATVQEIETILAAEQPLNGEEWTGRIVRWLQSGRILFDRAGRLSRLKQKVTSGNWISPALEMNAYQTWFGINYNYVQSMRMSRSPDPVYHLAVRMRLLYSLSDILGGYFTLRQLLWPGEKGAIQYLTLHDPTFLALFSECLQESNFERLMLLYEQLASLATAPLGGLWAEEVTVFQLDEQTSPSQSGAERALLWWQSLVGD